MNQPALTARGLCYSYRHRRALRDLGFRVEAGEIYGFLGPNGGGKSTLFRLLATLLPLQEGEVVMFGRDLVRDGAGVRRQLGVVFQSPSVDPHLTVGENLLHQAHLYGLRGRELEARAAALLGRFGLDDRRRERVKILSGGLRRRVEIAKALLHHPRLLLLDEPSTGLDPGARRDLWNTLEELRREDGVTVLLTTHFMEEGDRCDRLSLLDGGRIVAEGRPSELKEEIGGDVVVVRAREAADLGQEIRQRFGLEATVHGDQLRFERERAHEFVSRLAESFPGRIEAVTVAKPTLEDVFLRRTGHGLWERDAR